MFLRTTTSVLALACATAMAANAQDVSPDTVDAGNGGTRVLDVITVTAQKREQNAQDVPIAMTAFGGERLEELGIVDISGLSNNTPNVNLDNSSPFGASQAILTAFVRGIGSDDFAFNIDPGVGVYIDGVYLARSVGANQSLLDVQRIEILKGPQGTLFGRNTIGGAISVVTSEPADTYGANLDVTYGSDNLFQVRGLVEGPLSDTVSASLAFSHRQRDGYLERVPFPDPTAYNGTPETEFPFSGYDSGDAEGAEDTQTVRGQLMWRGERTSVRLSADYTRDRSTQASSLIFTTAGVPLALQTPATAGLDSIALDGPFLDPDPTDGFDGLFFGGLYNFCLSMPDPVPNPALAPLCGTRGQIGSSLQIDTPLFGNPRNMSFYDNRFVSPDIDQTYSDDPNFSELDLYGIAINLDHDLTDNLTVKSITGWRQQEWASAMDVDGSPLNILTTTFLQEQEQISQEFQLLGNGLAGDRLDFVLGAYYFREEGELQDYVLFDEGLLFVDGFNTFETENYAVFGQLEYDLTETVTLLLGGRYTHEEKQFEGGQRDLNGGNYRNFPFCTDPATGYPDSSLIIPGFIPGLGGLSCAVGVPPAPYFDPDTFRVYEPGLQTLEFDNFSPKIGIQYFPADGIQLYATYSQGYKTGGWTTRLQNPLPADQTQFNEEEATTVEIGLKSEIFNNRVRFNAALFRTDYENIQLNFQRGISPTLQNAGDAEINGFEADVMAILSDAWSLQASVGWLDTEFTSIAPAVTAASGPNPFQAGITVGGQLPKAPEWQLNLSPRFETRLGAGDLAVQGNLTYASETFNQVERVFALQRDETFLADLIVSYALDDRPLTMTAGIRNIGDERYLVTGVPNPSAGVFSGTYNRGREWFLSLGYEF